MRRRARARSSYVAIADAPFACMSVRPGWRLLHRGNRHGIYIRTDLSLFYEKFFFFRAIEICVT